MTGWRRETAGNMWGGRAIRRGQGWSWGRARALLSSQPASGEHTAGVVLPPAAGHGPDWQGRLRNAPGHWSRISSLTITPLRMPPASGRGLDFQDPEAHGVALSWLRGGAPGDAAVWVKAPEDRASDQKLLHLLPSWGLLFCIPQGLFGSTHRGRDGREHAGWEPPSLPSSGIGRPWAGLSGSDRTTCNPTQG